MRLALFIFLPIYHPTAGMGYQVEKPLVNTTGTVWSSMCSAFATLTTCTIICKIQCKQHPPTPAPCKSSTMSACILSGVAWLGDARLTSWIKIFYHFGEMIQDVGSCWPSSLYLLRLLTCTRAVQKKALILDKTGFSELFHLMTAVASFAARCARCIHSADHDLSGATRTDGWMKRRYYPYHPLQNSSIFNHRSSAPRHSGICGRFCFGFVLGSSYVTDFNRGASGCLFFPYRLTSFPVHVVY